jgi:hypothetical protein
MPVETVTGVQDLNPGSDRAIVPQYDGGLVNVRQYPGQRV